MFTAPKGQGRAAWKAPYDIPGAGEVVEISTNAESDVKPSTHSMANWHNALYGSFSGGALVEDYSRAGAYVIAGTGGHTSRPNLGACIFDFEDATWKRLDNANGVAQQNVDFEPGEIDAFGEIIAATTPGIPAPAHLYAHCHQLRASQGGGPKGSFMRQRGLSAATDSSKGSSYSHAIDLSTGLWTRRTTNANVTLVSSRVATYDPVTRRFIQMNQVTNSGIALQYVDEADWTWKTDNFANPGDKGNAHGFILDAERRLLLVTTSNETLHAFDADNIVTLTDLSLSGSMQNNWEQYQWAYYPPDGCFYRFAGATTSTAIEKLKPPPFGDDPLTEDWTVSMVNLGTALTQQPAASLAGGSIHHNRFFFVPRLNCLAWIPGDDEPVVILKPPAA